MKLRQFQCLCGVVDAGFNVSTAAGLLHATQPAIGKQLRQLEAELGVAVFVRRGTRLIGLSSTGESILPWARAAIRSAGNIREIGIEARAGGTASIVVATTHTHARYVLLAAVVAFSKRHPGVSLNLLQGTPEGVMDLVRKGSADIGVTSQPRHLVDGVASIPFMRIPHGVVAPAGHPLLKVRTLTLAAMARYPVIAHNASRPMGEEIHRRFAEAGLSPTFAVQALDSDVMKSYVLAGLGIAIIPKIAFLPRPDAPLRLRDVSHLFEPTVTSALLCRGAHVKRSVSDFLRIVSPEMTRARVEAAVVLGQAEDGGRGG